MPAHFGFPACRFGRYQTGSRCETDMPCFLFYPTLLPSRFFSIDIPCGHHYPLAGAVFTPVLARLALVSSYPCSPSWFSSPLDLLLIACVLSICSISQRQE